MMVHLEEMKTLCFDVVKTEAPVIDETKVICSVELSGRVSVLKLVSYDVPQHHFHPHSSSPQTRHGHRTSLLPSRTSTLPELE